MKKNVLIEVNKVSKKFCKDLKRSLWYGTKDLASDLLGLTQNRSELRKDEFWAVKDVSFQVERGECLGLIGHNGAGKSTLLKMLNGLIRPDEGKVKIRGRVGALIELTAGFNPILTGRENIYVNGQIIGFSKKDIDKKFDEIVEFAEIKDFIDMPVQNYSSGMKVRLGFAVAAQMEPDVLLIDEVLAVGDVNFRSKCYQKIAALRKSGTAMILVSHNPLAMLSSTNRAILLEHGCQLESGDTSSVLTAYEERVLSSQINNNIEKKDNNINRRGQNLSILEVYIEDQIGNHHPILNTGQEVNIKIKGKVYKKVENVNFKIIIKDLAKEEANVLIFDTEKDAQAVSLEPGNFEIAVHIPFLGLNQGLYMIKVFAQQEYFSVLSIYENLRITVKNSENRYIGALFYLPYKWKYNQYPALSNPS